MIVLTINYPKKTLTAPSVFYKIKQEKFERSDGEGVPSCMSLFNHLRRV